MTKALESVNWKQYGLDHPGGKGLLKGPASVDSSGLQTYNLPVKLKEAIQIM